MTTRLITSQLCSMIYASYDVIIQFAFGMLIPIGSVH